MSDVFTPEKRSAVMSSIRGKGNRSTELRLIQLMRDARITGWRRGSKLPGRPDFVFAKARLAIFVDGDFWHGHPRNFRLPTINREFWEKKIETNKKRDRTVGRLLRAKGWTVLRIWESTLRTDSPKAVVRLCSAMKSLSKNPTANS